jgi:glycerol uptake facilitator-like aquaporin
VLAASLGPISGAHFNPAVTLGLAMNGRFPWAYAPTYLAAQVAGAVAAAAVTWVLYGQSTRRGEPRRYLPGRRSLGNGRLHCRGRRDLPALSWRVPFTLDCESIDEIE